jgi:hypothetical protein
MIWTFTRAGARLRYEIRKGAAPQSYEIAVTRSGHEPEIERLDDASALIERSLTLQQGLIDEGWRPETGAKSG